MASPPPPQNLKAEDSSVIEQSDLEMSDKQKTQPSTGGRGRGSPRKGMTVVGPWTRMNVKKVYDVRLPKAGDGEFSLSSTSFPPLPSISTSGEDCKKSVLSLSPNSFSPLPSTSISENDTKNKPKNEADEGKEDETDLPNPDNNYQNGEENDTKNVKPKNEADEGKEDDTDFLNSDNNYQNGEEEEKKNVKPKNEASKAKKCEETNFLRDNKYQNDKGTSNLSPYAEEFIPQKWKMNPAADDFVPAFNQIESSEKEPDMGDLINDLEETLCFCYTTINESPGIFDELMNVVEQHFVISLKHPQLVSMIASGLYGYALSDTSFAYHAVRMLVYLIKLSGKILDTNHLRGFVLKMSQDEVERISKPEILNSEEHCGSIVPTLMFISELYIQLEVGNGRLCMIGQSLIEILKLLLDTERIPIKERLISILNIVKLTGTFLDKDDISLLDGLVEKLQITLNNQRQNLDNAIIDMVENVITLRNDNWGGNVGAEHNNEVENLGDEGAAGNNEGEPAHSLQNDLPCECHNEIGEIAILGPVADHNNMVFYGPDGCIIPYEEQIFLECHMINPYAVDQQSEPSPGSMDGEMEEAYQEFLLTIPLPMDF